MFCDGGTRTLRGTSQKMATKCLQKVSLQGIESKRPHMEMFFAAITACTFLGMLSKRFSNVSVGICVYSSKRAFVRSRTDQGLESTLQFIPKILSRVGVNTPIPFHQTGL